MIKITHPSYSLVVVNILRNSLVANENSVIKYLLGGHNGEGELSWDHFENTYQVKNLTI